MKSSGSGRSGIAVAEVLVVVGVIGLLMSLLLPAVQSARESARGNECRVRLKNIGVACHNHLDAHRIWPPIGRPKAYRQFDDIPTRYTPHCHLLAFTEDAWVHDLINYSQRFVPEPPRDENETAFSKRIRAFLCPSEQIPKTPFALCNYRFCFGSGKGDDGDRDGVVDEMTTFRDSAIADGLSHTALASEGRVGSFGRFDPTRDALLYDHLPHDTPHEVWLDVCRFRSALATEVTNGGAFWHAADAFHTLYNHAVTPNHRIVSCGGGASLKVGLFPARSRHPGGVNLLTGDGSVRFQSDSVDSEVWRALATRANGDRSTNPW